jgi:hypothetical protein
MDYRKEKLMLSRIQEIDDTVSSQFEDGFIETKIKENLPNATFIVLKNGTSN